MSSQKRRTITARWRGPSLLSASRSSDRSARTSFAPGCMVARTAVAKRNVHVPEIISIRALPTFTTAIDSNPGLTCGDEAGGQQAAEAQEEPHEWKHGPTSGDRSGQGLHASGGDLPGVGGARRRVRRERLQQVGHAEAAAQAGVQVADGHDRALQAPG